MSSRGEFRGSELERGSEFTEARRVPRERGEANSEGGRRGKGAKEIAEAVDKKVELNWIDSDVQNLLSSPGQRGLQSVASVSCSSHWPGLAADSGHRSPDYGSGHRKPYYFANTPSFLK